MAQMSDDRWEELRRDLLARVAAFAPDWTEHTESDPGITLVDLFAFLAEELLSRAEQIPEARARLRDVLEQLDRADESGCDDRSLTRPHFITGDFLTAGDLEQEQSYHRTKHRRHNRLVHGVGIVRGLAVNLEPRPAGGNPTVLVSPGVAISPDGEEVVVCESVKRDVCQGVSACYVTLALADRPVDPMPEGEYSRIEESAEVAVSEVVLPGHLAIARLLRDGGVWRSDQTFKAPRVQ